MLRAAAACLAGLAALMVLAYYVEPTRTVDANALHGFAVLERPRIDSVARFLSHLCDVFPYALAGVAVIAAALIRKGLRTAAAVGLLLVGANVTTQLLKVLLAHHRDIESIGLTRIRDAAFPSGHATAAMSLALAILIVVPRAYRPLAAALGALFTVAVSFSILVLAWHFPSDVVGGYLVATAWGLTASAALQYVNERWPLPGSVREVARGAVSTAAIARAGLALAAVCAVLAASQAHRVAGFADRHTALVAVASAIAVSAGLLLAAVAALSNRPSS